MMRQEAEYNTVLREPLCACMNRDPTVPLPPSSALCERGAVQAKLMKVFNKVRRLADTRGGAGT